MKKVIHILMFCFSSPYRRELWRKEINWCEKQVKAIAEENKVMRDTFPIAPAAITNDLKSNCVLLGGYEKRIRKLRKKLGRDNTKGGKK